MTDVRQLLDNYSRRTIRGLSHEQHAPKAFAALRAVLDLHQPHGNGSLTCVECSEREDTYDDIPWPCPTVTAITTALEAS